MTSTNSSTTLDESLVKVPPPVAQVTTIPSAEGCDVRAHPVDHHDQIARRYCTATFTNVITRGCICG
jgi:hypothetical protein